METKVDGYKPCLDLPRMAPVLGYGIDCLEPGNRVIDHFLGILGQVSELLSWVGIHSSIKSIDQYAVILHSEWNAGFSHIRKRSETFDFGSLHSGKDIVFGVDRGCHFSGDF